MAKLNDKEITNEITEVNKRFLINQLKNIDVNEIIKYEYQKNTGLIDEDNWEKIIIIRKSKRFGYI